MSSTPIHRQSFDDSRRRFSQPERRRLDRRSTVHSQKDWLLFHLALYYTRGNLVLNSAPVNKLLPFPIRLPTAGVCLPISRRPMLRESSHAKPAHSALRQQDASRRSHESSIRHHTVPNRAALANSPAQLSPNRRNTTSENPDNR